uniref:Glucagon n=1 Tax=Gadus morhua TaxID=8049 RepID=A0A8C5FWV6_GADMO
MAVKGIRSLSIVAHIQDSEYRISALIIDTDITFYSCLFVAPYSPETEMTEVDESKEKRHSDGTFSSDYSKYLEDRKAQDFVKWLMNNKRGSSPPAKRHADGTYTSDVSAFLEEQAAKDFVAWLKNGQVRRNIFLSVFPEVVHKRHVDGSFTSDVNKVLDAMAAKEYLHWVMTAKPSGER